MTSQSRETNDTKEIESTVTIWGTDPLNDEQQDKEILFTLPTGNQQSN